ncbi:MAG: hypothetical protein RL563_497 [Pseudomonadota bacterium]|jgi:hypothetical protein
MFTIIKNIPKKITIDEFAEALQPFVLKGIFKKRSELKALKFLDLVDRHGELVERHAIVRVNGETIQKSLIQAVNQNLISLLTPASGPHMESCKAAPFAVRWHGNDRRQHREGLNGSRKYERRRYDLNSVISSEKES